MTELYYQVALSMIPGIGSKLAQVLVANCGSAEAVFNETAKNLQKINAINPSLVKEICQFNKFSRVEEEIVFIEKNNITPVFYLSKSYPKRLIQCADFPILLYTKGNLTLESERMLSIVGTRNATSYGKDFCDKLIKEFAMRQYNICIVSGLAYGIDIAAHQACVRYDVPTVGVVAHGLDQLYPSLHRKTADAMLRRGGIVSEFTSKTNISPSFFIRRNRIIAGLCDATLVVESAQKGGSLYTAEIASGYSREVLSVPGRTGDKYSAGCNKIIKNNMAALVESIDDIENIMQWHADKIKPKTIQRKLFLELTPEEQKVVDILTNLGATQIDSLCTKTGYNFPKMSSLLLSLEFSGVVRSLPGKQFDLIE